jgi:hypothetical protein
MPDLLAPQLQFSSGTPDRMIMIIEGLDEQSANYLAINAVYAARLSMPRVTGVSANRLQPVHGEGFFGIYFPDAYTWYQERGTKPFTMRSLAGKTIPMWVSDEDGALRSKNPKIKVRTTEDGRVQVLIFRRAARLGERKTVRRKNPVTGAMETTTTVASYPGAPGRINRRVPGQPGTPVGRVGGQIGAGNVGVRWRHPGLRAAQFLNAAIARSAFEAGFLLQTIYACDGAEWESLVKRKGLKIAN